MKLIFDIESNGLLDVISEIHCICAYDIETRTKYQFADQTGEQSLTKGLDLLAEAEELIGHNIIGFDIPAIKKVYPLWKHKGKLVDTMCITRLIYTNLFDLDCTKYRRKLPNNKLMNSHSLKAWGYRLGMHKGDYDGGWETWSREMQDYCMQDVIVNLHIWDMIAAEQYSQRAMDLECDFQVIMARQMERGIPFNVEKARKLEAEVRAEMEPMEIELRKLIPDWVEKSIFIPKVNNKSRGYVKGVPIEKVKHITFNFRSRTQIVKYFKQKYHWSPVEFTKKGNPKIGSDVLNSLSYPEAAPLAIYLEADKLLSQLAEGEQAWLKKVVDGRLYGYINTNGARTGRCTHSRPNLAQVPRVTSYRGAECRSLFEADEGMKMVGCDASGIELRNLAHFMQPYDEGKYVDVILNEDVHTVNQRAAGLPSRDNAKTFIYALNYGAGDAKLGSITHPEASDTKKKLTGTHLRAKFMRGMPAMSKLLRQVKFVHRTRGYFIGLDGRKLLSISEHSALNTLLQGAGAVIMKEATVITWRKIAEAGLFDIVFPALNVHDENQVIAPEDKAEEVGEMMKQAIIEAGVNFEYNCPLDAEYKIGNNWAETH